MNKFNDKGKKHGYWEGYYSHSKLMYKGNYNNGVQTGCWEWYYLDGNLLTKEFFSSSDIEGYSC